MKRIVYILLTVFGFAALGSATSPFNFQGQIFTPSGSSEQDSNVEFKIQIYSPGSSDCLLYSETQTLNMANSNGFFSLVLNSSASTRTDGGSYSIEQVMGNNGTFTVGSCTYTPGTYDGRVIQVSFSDSTMGGSFESFPTESINYVPKAIDAEQVAGFPASSLLRVANSGVPGTATALTEAQYANLQALLNGTSTQYVPASTTGGALVPTISSPSSLTTGDMWLNSTGQLQYYNGTTTVTVGTSGSGLTSLAVSNNLTANGTAGGTVSNGAVAIDLNATGVTVGQYTKVTVDQYGRVSAGTSITGSDITSGTIGGTTAISIPTSPITAASVSASGASFRSLVLNDSETPTPKTVTLQTQTTMSGSSYVLTLPPALPTAAGQTLASDMSGNLSWTSNVSLPEAGGTMTGPLDASDGLVSQPGFAFANDTGTGFYDVSGGVIGVSSGGLQAMTLSNAGITGSGAMTVEAGGSNQPLTLNSSGTGSVNVGTGDGTGFSVLDGGSNAANYITVKGAASGSSPTLGTAGPDTNINLMITPKGTGSTVISSGNLGIGTTNPTALLSVGTTNQFQVDGSGDVTANSIGATYAMFQTVNGVTYSSSSSSSPLPMNGGPAVVVANNSPSAGMASLYELSVKNSTNQQQAYIGAVSEAGGGAYTPAIVIGQQTGSTAYAERMRIDQNGNVGIGTVAPPGNLAIDNTGHNATLCLNGNCVSSLGGSGGLSSSGGTMTGELMGDNGSSSSPSFGFAGNTNTGFYDAGGSIGVSSNGIGVMSFSSSGIVGTEALTIESGAGQPLTLGSGSGSLVLNPNVGIGTTTPQAPLDVNGAIDIGGANAISFPTKDTTAGGSVAIGVGALLEENVSSSAAFGNTAVGYNSMSSSTLTTSATNNTAVGYLSLQSVSSGSSNTALGAYAMMNTTSGNSNTAVGWESLANAGAGSDNTAMGYATLSDSNGTRNTAFGAEAMMAATGTGNTGVGYAAGSNLTTGSNNILIGDYTGTGGVTTGNDNILIGYDVRPPSVTGTGQLNIGNLIYAAGLSTGSTLSTGFVGIGTAAPQANLHVYAGSNPSIELSNAGGANMEMGVSSSIAAVDAPNVPLQLGSGTTTVYLGYNTNNVGIGTTAPIATLDVHGHIGSSGSIPGSAATPTVISCASGTLTSGSTDTRGQVTFPSTGTDTCEIQFASNFSGGPPFCVVSWAAAGTYNVNSGYPVAVAGTTSQYLILTVGGGSAFLAGDVFNYICMQ